MVETDGPYGGGLCSATNHTHHHGVLDSQYWQARQPSRPMPSTRKPRATDGGNKHTQSLRLRPPESADS